MLIQISSIVSSNHRVLLFTWNAIHLITRIIWIQDSFYIYILCYISFINFSDFVVGCIFRPALVRWVDVYSDQHLGVCHTLIYLIMIQAHLFAFFLIVLCLFSERTHEMRNIFKKKLFWMYNLKPDKDLHLPIFKKYLFVNWNKRVLNFLFHLLCCPVLAPQIVGMACPVLV